MKGLDNGIDENYPLLAGDWDIQYRDLKNDTTSVMRYQIIKTTPIKQCIVGGLTIIKAMRVR